jgi:Zn-dependent protease with chaperone function
MSINALLLWPLIASVALGLAGPRLGRALPPAAAVRLLTTAALVSALATGFALAVAAFGAIARVPFVSSTGHWSVTALDAGQHVPAVAGALAGSAVIALAITAARRALRSGRELVTAALICRDLADAAGGLVVIHDEHPDAYALPGIRGRVVISTAMLHALSGDERRVLLAHEAAHLSRGHHIYIQLAELAAAANPLLRPVARAVSAAVEREADEIAATEVGDRRIAARALARAGLARASASVRRPALAGALGATDGNVVARARALLAPPPRHRRILAACLTTVILVTSAVSVVTAKRTEWRFETAEASYARHA